MNNGIVFAFVLAIFITLGCDSGHYRCLAQEPYRGGVQENIHGAPDSGSSYPAPQMIPVPGPPVSRPPANTWSGNAGQYNNNARKEIFSAGVTAVALPPAYLGNWQVHGQRTAVEAMPEFQAGAEQAFSLSNDQIWSISGNRSSGYSLGSNTGITTVLIVDNVQGSTAYLRYQHPVGKTMAQEAIVMTLLPGGMQFDGLERISIVKQGLPQPRAKVTYRLSGTRQQ